MVYVPIWQFHFSPPLLCGAWRHHFVGVGFYVGCLFGCNPFIGRERRKIKYISRTFPRSKASERFSHSFCGEMYVILQIRLYPSAQTSCTVKFEVFWTNLSLVTKITVIRTIVQFKNHVCICLLVFQMHELKKNI